MYVLGFAAGRRVAQILRATPVGDVYCDRSALRSVAGEIAFLIRHRFENKFRDLVKKGNAAEFERRLNSCKKGKTNTLSYLERSWHI